MSHPDTANDWIHLSLEIRLQVWNYFYSLQAPRIVEVGTRCQPHYEHEHAWCPRFSPSPRPVIFNICHEAREITRQLARRAGQLLFSTQFKLRGRETIYRGYVLSPPGARRPITPRSPTMDGVSCTTTRGDLSIVPPGRR